MCIVELYLSREFIGITKPYHSTDTMQLVSQVLKGKCQELELELREEDVRHREKETRGGRGGGGRSLMFNVMLILSHFKTIASSSQVLKKVL